MKTKATTATTFNFNPIRQLILDMDVAEVRAFNLKTEVLIRTTAIWNATPQDKRVIKVFRDEFTAATISWGFSESWAKKCLASLEFLRMRQQRSDKGGQRGGKPNKPSKSTFAAWFATMPEKMTHAEAAKAIAKLSAML